MKSLKSNYYFKAFMLTSALCLVGGIGKSLAQQPTAPNEFHLTIKSTDVNVIGKALGKLPFDEVAELLQSLRAQIIEQSVPKAVEPATEKPITPPNPPPFAQDKAK